MPVLIVIPARYASSRYPGKPLVELKGATGSGKTLIERGWQAARSVGGIDRVVIATDDDRIAQEGGRFGAEVLMTPETCRNGTERCAVAANMLGREYDIVVNFQGDAPLTPPAFIEALITQMQKEPDCQMATPVLRCSAQALSGFREDRKNGRVGATTAVFDQSGNALYFSKEVIPYSDGIVGLETDIPVFHHVGVYAYRQEALETYPIWPQGQLEKCEGLEQLRFLEQNVPVRCVEVSSGGLEFWELNNPSDVEKLERILVVQKID